MKRTATIRLPPRRDLHLEALVDIMNGDLKVHAHSYRRDEMLMLMRVAEDFGFRIHTFQHVLEGYKVADEMAAHGAMASTFAENWAAALREVPRAAGGLLTSVLPDQLSRPVAD